MDVEAVVEATSPQAFNTASNALQLPNTSLTIDRVCLDWVKNSILEDEINLSFGISFRLDINNHMIFLAFNPREEYYSRIKILNANLV